MEFYKEGCQVVYYDPINKKLREAIVLGHDARSFYKYKLKDKDETFWYHDFYIGLDKKKLLLKLLWNEKQVISEAQKEINKHTLRANDIRVFLSELDNTMDIEKELEEYKNEL